MITISGYRFDIIDVDLAIEIGLPESLVNRACKGIPRSVKELHEEMPYLSHMEIQEALRGIFGDHAETVKPAEPEPVLQVVTEEEDDLFAPNAFRRPEPKPELTMEVETGLKLMDKPDPDSLAVVVGKLVNRFGIDSGWASKAFFDHEGEYINRHIKAMDYLPENLRDDGEVLKTRIERNTDVPMRMKQELKTASSIKQSLSQSNEIQDREIANGNARYKALTKEERISVNKQVAARIPDTWMKYQANREGAHIATISLIDAERRQIMKELGLWTGQ